ncbi:MAG TPA: phosphoribosyltransferase [Burkholderiaceae bacterium]
MFPAYFRDRHHAGQLLAVQLQAYAGRDDVMVLALPRGGVPVAHPVAEALGAPLDVLIVCKIGAPGHAEYALGALGANGVRVAQQDAMRIFGVRDSELDALAEPVSQEVARRERRYRAGKDSLNLHGRTVILIDDGLATGATMLAAVRIARESGAMRVIACAPVGSKESVALLREAADSVVCMRVPPNFMSVGLWYDRFDQVTDDEVLALLDAAAEPRGAQAAAHLQPPSVH